MTGVTWHREAPCTTRGASSILTRWLERRREHRHDEQRASRLVSRFLAVAGNVGLSQDTESCAGIPGLSAPQVRHVTLGAEVEKLTIQMLPGQLVKQYQALASEMAEGLGVASVAFHWRLHGVVIAELRRRDPLTSPVELPEFTRGTPASSVLVGLLDTGQPLDISLSSSAHMLVQGQTRSGKSRWAYGFLSQLAGCADVHISGSDVSGLLLRPFQHTRHGDLLALGTADPYRHAEVLETLVMRMDERIARIPEDADVLPASSDDPYELVVIEELPGLIQAASNEDNAHKGEKNRPSLVGRIQAAYGRLVAEGAKVGFRLLIVMQRADANIVGGFSRGQCTLRLSFSVDDPAAVRMLHASASQDQADAHTVAPPARALVSGPGIPVSRLRAPEMGDYAQFRANIAGAADYAGDTLPVDSNDSVPADV